MCSRARVDAFGQTGEDFEGARLVTVYSFPSGSYAEVHGISRSRSETRAGYGKDVEPVT